MTPDNASERVEVLKPCPFCQAGDLAPWQPCSGGGHGIICRRCHVTMDARAATKADAITAWNTRTSTAESASLREALTDGLRDMATAERVQWQQRARAALAASPASVAGWMPIESAPRDGSEVDLFGFPLKASDAPVRMTDCHYHCGEWLRWGYVEDEDGSHERIFRPTHWQPRPAPPAALTGEDA